MSTTAGGFDVQNARSHFPSLESGYVFADNAGGSQVVRGVVDRISDYLLNTNVQLGADYPYSVLSTARVAEGVVVAQKLLNAPLVDEVVLGSSSTMNLENLARGLESDIQAGDEFIVTGEHEANAGPWKKLAARTGAIIKYWHSTPTKADNPYSVSLKIEELLPLITSKTRIIAFTACSNILGSIVPVAEVTKAIHATAKEKGAKKVEISVDCVAYAPHRRMDVQAWDIDFCVFSFYKVYGPHLSGLYVRKNSLLTSIASIAHHFLPVNENSYKLQPGGPGYELVYGCTGVIPYLTGLTSAGTLEAAFDAIAEHEQTLVKPLLDFLTHDTQRQRGVRVIGQETGGIERVPTISFVVTGENAISSKAVVQVFDATKRIGIRFGHFYAYTLVDELKPKLVMDDGAIRVSLVHYNTVAEVEMIIEVLKKILKV